MSSADEPHAPEQPDRLAFLAQHRPALERDEVRHNVLLSILDRMAADERSNIRRWTLGAPGACAVQTPGFPVVLGELSHAQCHALAEQTRDLDYPGVVGPEHTATWFADRAAALGIAFLEPIPQQIHALSDPPHYPGAPGHARPAGSADAALLYRWTVEFMREAVPHDRSPSRAEVDASAVDGRSLFWVVDGAPVSTARIARRLKSTAAISVVYTPPALRGRGYAGSVTAAIVEHIFAGGRSTVCLYVDLRNPFSNRCYAKIGFTPVCESLHIPRVLGPQKA
jgi:ribosomal protein S18 acetylase RimI-like enzyme